MFNQKLLRRLLVSVLFFALAKYSIGQESFSQRNFSFTLKSSAITSAGVFKNDGTLIRTLWGNKLYSAGTHVEAWDGLTDDGEIATADLSYQVKVLSNNVRYDWEGVIGNTSDSSTGSTVHHYSEGMIYGMTIVGGYAYYCVGYHERTPTYFKFKLNDIQKKLHVNPLAGAKATAVATDGVNMYWGADNVDEKKTFIIGSKISDDADVLFSKGVPFTPYLSRSYKSVIDLTNDNSFGEQTSVAVQKKGNFLFSCHRSLNEIHVLDKVTGAKISTISLSAPLKIAIDPGDDSKVWVIYNKNQVSKFTVNTNGSLSKPLLSINGLLQPLAIAVSPTSGNIAICDGASSQQVKFFNGSTGTYINAVGEVGGYKNSPIVTNYKLMFKNSKRFKQSLDPEDNSFSFICFAPDGSFWIGDTGNYRAIHYSSNGIFIEKIMNTGYVYSAGLDVNNPTRVFANYLEFKVDYSKPLSPANGSWELVKNWSYVVDPAKYDNQYQRMKDVTTLSNGRTYAIIKNTEKNVGEIVELPLIGNMRFTGIYTNAFNTDIRANLNADGSLISFSSTELGKPVVIQKRPLISFDNNGNPNFGAIQSLAKIDKLTGADPLASGVTGLFRNMITSSGLVIFYNPGNPYSASPTPNRGYASHLGALKTSDNKWLWKTSFVTNTNYRGKYPQDGAFDVGNGVNAYAGSFAGVVDKNIFWGYNGEFWKASQTNMYNHYYDNGLMIGQFGTTGPFNYPQVESPAMMAGNAKTGTFVKVGENIYLYHADESFHGGIHRWKISGLNTIKEQVVEFLDIAKEPLLGNNLMKGLPTYAKLSNGTYGWNRNPLNENGNFWTVSTNYLTYQKNSQDLMVKLNTTKGIPSSGTVTRDLGNNSKLSEWSITGRIAYLLESEPDTDYIEVLDAKNKIICRIKRNANFYFNNVPIVSSPNYKTVYSAIKDLNPISIIANDNGITFTYNNLKPTTVSPLDSSADWRSPKTFRVYLYDANGRGHHVDIADLRFTVYSATGTPDEPIIFANDATNILSASHALGISEIEVSTNNEQFKPYLGQINVGNVTKPRGFWKFRTKASSGRNPSSITESPAFTYTNITPVYPSINADDEKNTLNASHGLGASEILISENGGPFTPYSGAIDVGNIARPEGYWLFKIKAANDRNESDVIKSPAFTYTTTFFTPDAPTILSSDDNNTLSASHPLGSSIIKMSVNNGPFYGYYGQINVGNVSRPKGYWRFKVAAKGERRESPIAESPAFTATYTQTEAPTLTASDEKNTLSASHPLGNSMIKMSVNNGPFYGYYGEIFVGNISRPKGYWKFKIEAKGDRNESPVTESPAFTITYTTTEAPVIIASDESNTLSVSHPLGNSVIKMSVNNGPFYGYYGAIAVGNVSRAKGYWRFKVEAKGDRSESPIAESPAFTITYNNTEAPTVIASDEKNTLSASHPLGNSVIKMSVNNGPFYGYYGEIKVGDKSYPKGYWKFRIEAKGDRRESPIVESPAFTVGTNLRVANSRLENGITAGINSNSNIQKDPFILIEEGQNLKAAANLNPNDLKNEATKETFRKVITSKSSEKVTVFPNPVKGNNLSINLIGFAAGTYQARLMNALGNVIMTMSISHATKDAPHSIILDRNLHSGVYFIEIASPGKSIISRVIKN